MPVVAVPKNKKSTKLWVSM